MSALFQVGKVPAPVAGIPGSFDCRCLNRLRVLVDKPYVISTD
jgi:hypothetical protein